MGEYDRTVRYLFILALVLIAVAYFAGSSKILGSLFGGLNMLGLTFSGRNQQGQFANYPTGG